ncbi:MAG TPA: helix-turn-helix domain-containing protein [Polyangiaceae bacterium]
MCPRAAAAVAETPPPLLSAGLVTASSERPSAAHAELELCFAYGGAVRYFIGGRFVRLSPGVLAVFWAALPHRLVELAPGAQLMHLELPLHALWRWQLGTPFVRKLLAGELVVDAHGLAWDGELTRRWLEDLAGGDAAAARICELEVEARVRRLACRRQQRSAEHTPGQTARRQVEAIADFLGSNYRENISSGDIGRAVGLHPNYTMTLFRREAGMSLWQFLIRRRLAHAQQLLLGTEKPVLAIALESGFGSLARFYAAFTREHGLSPGEFRKRRL